MRASDLRKKCAAGKEAIDYTCYLDMPASRVSFLQFKIYA